MAKLPRDSRLSDEEWELLRQGDRRRLHQRAMSKILTQLGQIALEVQALRIELSNLRHTFSDQGDE